MTIVYIYIVLGMIYAFTLIFNLQVNFILRIEEIPYLHKRYKKDFDDETFRVNDDRSYLRNQFHRTPVWNTVIRLLFYKNKKNDADEMPATVSVDMSTLCLQLI